MANRIIWIDLIKVLAMFSVIFLHSAAPILYKIGTIDFSYWMIGNIYDSMVRMAVPLFFMVSGVLLLNGKDEPLLTFFQKRFIKVFIPLIAWSFIYIILKKYGTHQDINIVKNMIYSLNRPEYFHLWFLYTILGIYFFIPILKIFIKYASENNKMYFIVLWIISVSIIPFINKISGYSINSYMPMMAGYIGYFVLGYQLAKIKITKRIFFLSFFFIVISTLITIFGTYYLSNQVNMFDGFFYEYFSVSTLIQAIAYFIFLRYIGQNILNKSTKIPHLITTLSMTSLGIYLIHPIYINILSKVEISIWNGNPIVMIPFISILTFLLSFLTIFMIQKVPIIKQIVP